MSVVTVMNALNLQNLKKKIGPVAITLIAVTLALVAGGRIWYRYQVEPWTPDGRVRADIVQVAPDVAGLVTQLSVINDQPVKQGQVLFQIDPVRYELALRQAEARLESARTTLIQARREAARNHALGNLVANENKEQGSSRVEVAAAALAQAQVERDEAALNLERTTVRAATDGILSDLNLRVGNYVSAGKPVLALIDSSSFRVEGYFEETKLGRIHVGQTAQVRLMGDDRVLQGKVVSIASGIEDRDRTAGNNLLPNVNPTFSWVRLAQRVPVRVALDGTPDQLGLVAGRTASVTILPEQEGDHS